MAVPSVQINGEWVSVERFFGQSLEMSTPADVCYTPDQADVAYTVPAGQPIGTVFSWVTNGQGLWFMLDDNTFVRYAPSVAMPPPLGQYGAGTLPAPQSSSWTDTIGSLFSAPGLGGLSLGMIALLAAGALVLLSSRGGSPMVILAGRR